MRFYFVLTIIYLSGCHNEISGVKSDPNGNQAGKKPVEKHKLKTGNKNRDSRKNLKNSRKTPKKLNKVKPNLNNVKVEKVKPDYEKPEMVFKPIIFNDLRKKLSLKYIKKHYGKTLKKPEIKPVMVVVHWTESGTFKSAWWTMEKPYISKSRKYVGKASLLNVSAHFLVDRKGKIFQLMGETYFARHTIGLNLISIGIENVGGTKRSPLTKKQLKSNIKLIRYLVLKYKIKYVIGHFEYLSFRKTPLWMELNPKYITYKKDPGKKFINNIRKGLKDLKIYKVYKK
jgi:N-acetylmuramoyl-L-alanine amidase